MNANDTDPITSRAESIEHNESSTADVSLQSEHIAPAYLASEPAADEVIPHTEPPFHTCDESDMDPHDYHSQRQI